MRIVISSELKTLLILFFCLAFVTFVGFYGIEMMADKDVSWGETPLFFVYSIYFIFGTIICSGVLLVFKVIAFLFDNISIE